MKEFSDNWKVLNPDYEIQLYDNSMCEKFLLEEYGELYKDIFIFIKDGPIKADFWRICILYKYGGIYSDIDNEPLMPMSSFLDPTVDFMTCSSYWTYNFNPNFIGSNKNNSILKKCIEWYINKYTNEKEAYDYWGWSIMAALSDTLYLKNYQKKDGIYEVDNNILVIGASDTNEKIIHVNTNYSNNSYIITKQNWLGHDTYDDTFEVTINDGVCRVQRTDVGSGWGMKLQVNLDTTGTIDNPDVSRKVQILQECYGPDKYNDHNIYNNIRIFNNRYKEWDYASHSFK
jgi:hypothetical protein